MVNMPSQFMISGNFTALVHCANSREICLRMRLGGRKGVTYTKINKDGGKFFRMPFAFSLICNALCLFNPY